MRLALHGAKDDVEHAAPVCHGKHTLDLEAMPEFTAYWEPVNSLPPAQWPSSHHRHLFKRARSRSQVLADAFGSTPVVPLRRLCHFWEKRRGWHSFVALVIGTASWCAFQHHRVDALFGHTTYRMLRFAQEELNQPSYSEIDNIFELDDFLVAGLHHAMELMHESCPTCSLALTPMNADLRALDTHEFSCTDFESVAGTSSYPDRDCATANVKWAERPSVHGTPCCRNSTLALYSMLLMAWHASDGPEETSLAVLEELTKTLTENRKHDAFSASTTLVAAHATRTWLVDSDHLVQLVLSRGGRMVGVGVIHRSQAPADPRPFECAAPEVCLRRAAVQIRLRRRAVVSGNRALLGADLVSEAR